MKQKNLKNIETIEENKERKKMDRHQKRIFESLRFFANHKKSLIIGIKGGDPSYYYSRVPKDIEKILYNEKYISNKEKDCFDPQYMVTERGDKFIRGLKNIRYKDWSLWGIIIAIIISIIALLKSFGVI